MNMINEIGTDGIIKAVVITVVIALALWETLQKLQTIAKKFFDKHTDRITKDKTIEALCQENKEQEEKLDVLMNTTLAQIRHSIVRIALESLKCGQIEAYELESLEELFTTYSRDLHGNSYVHGLMDKVRQLPVDYSNGNPRE